MQHPEVLPKAMPWLWRLADEHQTPSHLQPQALPTEAREAVLEGLASAETTLERSHSAVSEESRCGATAVHSGCRSGGGQVGLRKAQEGHAQAQARNLFCCRQD